MTCNDDKPKTRKTLRPPQKTDGDVTRMQSAAQPLFQQHGVVRPESGQAEGVSRDNQHLATESAVSLTSSASYYADLYNSAPVGYFRLDQSGFIVETNVSGAGLFGMTRSSLLRRRLEEFIPVDQHAAFTAFLAQVFATTSKQTHELRFLDADRHEFFAHLEANAEKAGNICRLVLCDISADISARKKMEEALRQSRQMLRQLVSHQERVREDERKRIARELHDDLGQNLLALRIDVSILHHRTATSHPRLNRRVRVALDHIDATMKAARAAINNLRPTVLDLGLTAAIEWQMQEFQRRSGIRCTLAMDEDFVLADDRATALFRIVQESLNNVIRHAQASSVTISLQREGDVLLLRIADNGIGIYPDCRRKANSFGLLGIEERINALGGTLDILSNQESGTTLAVSLPLMPG